MHYKKFQKWVLTGDAEFVAREGYLEKHYGARFLLSALSGRHNTNYTNLKRSKGPRIDTTPSQYYYSWHHRKTE